MILSEEEMVRELRWYGLVAVEVTCGGKKDHWKLYLKEGLFMSQANELRELFIHYK